jgi:Cu(I)/Ag(I) efflux system membrane fusion protein
MKTTNKALILLLALGVLVTPGGVFRKHTSGLAAETAGRKVLYYQDSMHPAVKSDRPGKCTICGMDLTAIYEGDKGFAVEPGTIVLNSNNITVLNVQTEAVKQRPLSRSFRIAGTLEANETRKSIVSAPARGRIDALNVDYVGVEVERGQKLMTMFSPELVQLRKTLLAVRQVTGSDGMYPGSKANPDNQLYTGDILAPQSGVVLERNVYLGQYVTEGDRLLAIADASSLWFRFDVYERQLQWFNVGQKLDVTVQAAPGRVFPAVISFIEPALNEATRAVKVRADIPNPVLSNQGHPQRALRFGMYAEGVARATITNVMTIPRSAVLLPGSIAYAYVDKGGGAFERRRLKLGRQGDDYWEVLKGVEEGESVVTSGNVLMDSQAQFNATSQSENEVADDAPMIEPMPMPATNEMVTTHPADAQATMDMGSAPAAAMESHPADAQAPTTPTLAGEALNATLQPGMESEKDSSQSSPSTNKAPSYGKLASAGRTERMAAIMSPGSELQWVRRNAILAELAQRSTNGTPNAADQTPQPMAMTENQPAPQEAATPDATMQAAVPDSTTPTSETSASVPAEAKKANAADSFALTPGQRQALNALMVTSDAISQALAADDFAKFNLLLTNEPNALLALPKEFGADHRWGKLIEPLAAAAKAPPAADLDGARKQFLPFSTAMAELTSQLRKEDPAFAELKIYHCPMAPKPGLWMQAKGPLQNPFYGSKMLTCGEEVKK